MALWLGLGFSRIVGGGYCCTQLLFMIRTCTRVIRFGLKANRVDFTPHQLAKCQKIDFFPVVGIRERKLGACVLNQPANQNLLTEQFSEQLYRFLLSYQYDDTVENVWIQSKDAVFSHGLDYKRLSEDKNYLDKLAKLAILVAKFNKPTFAQVAGGVKGAGAYLLSMLTMPFTYPSSFLKLDETSRGLVPVMGGSHRLARMPLRLGYYLALTGDQFNSEEMAQVGLLKGAVCPGVSNSDIRSKFHEANLFFRQKFRYMDFDGEDALLEVDEQRDIEQKKERYRSEMQFRQGQLMTESSRNINVKFAVNQQLAARVDFENATNPHNSFSEEDSERTINNYYEMRLDRPLEYLQQHKLVTSFNIKGVQLKRLDVGRIDHIFGKSSLAEIMEALKEQKSEWAERAYRKIAAADPLASLLTFQLIKRAETLPWISCLEQEFAVVRKLVEGSSLELRTYKNSSHYVFVNDYSSKDFKSIDSSVVNAFFTEPQGEYKLEHDVKPYSLLPVCDYFRDVPDSARAYLNEMPFMDKHYSEQVPEIMRYLKTKKINYRSRVYDVALLRQKVYQQIEVQKQKQRHKVRLGYLANHDQALSSYLQKREKVLENIDMAKLEDTINDVLRDVFRQKFDGRFAEFENKTASMLGLEKKIEFFKGVKDIILNNLLYNGFEYEKKKQGKSDYNGPIYFDPQGKDIYSSINSYLLKDTAMTQLAEDMTKGVGISDEFSKFQKQPLPRFFGTPDEEMPFETRNREMWEKIKYQYDEKPQLWAEAYTYKELIEQASRTSEELAGYLDWTFQNFYDLLNTAERSRQTYGEYAIDMVDQVKKMRAERIKKLGEVQQQREKLVSRGMYTGLYELKDEEKTRQVFPFYFKDSTIPVQFKRAFLSVLDSTLQEFTAMKGDQSKRLLVQEQLGVLDRWINRDLTAQYTQFLKHDVEYVTSYLLILFVKDMLAEIVRLKMYGRGTKEAVNVMRDHFKVDLGKDVTTQQLDKSILTFLYYLLDMHTNAKKHIRSPQSKLIDFINRLKVSYQQNTDRSLPYSLQGLLLLIGKDRRKVFDRCIGANYISEPEFLQEYITRESNKTSQDILLQDQQVSEQEAASLKLHFDQHYNGRKRTKRLVQGYFYYIVEFERQIHRICGKDSFIPVDFVNPTHQSYNRYLGATISSLNGQQWLQGEVRAVLEQVLAQREEVEKRLTKGELYLYDQQLVKQLEPQNVRQLVKAKLTEEVFIVKNLFTDQRQYDYNATKDQENDFHYARVKRDIKNQDALKKLNNVGLSNEIYHAYMEKTQDEEGLSQEEKRFMHSQRKFYVNDGYCSRLPIKSYHRMTRDMFVYPEDSISIPTTEREVSLFKKTNINFKKSLAGEKINLTPFSSQYKQLNKKEKEDLLKQMVDKISKVEKL